MALTKDPNSDTWARFVHEFADHMGFQGRPEFSRIYTSRIAPDERFVLAVALDDKAYALKINFTSPQSGLLEREFHELKALHGHFSTYEKLGVAEPVYLSPSGQFFVMAYIDFQTAGQRLKDSQNTQTTRQVYRRAGLWLSAMHDFKPQSEETFSGGWMIETIDHHMNNEAMVAETADVTAMRDILDEHTQKLNGIDDTLVSSHGDFHSENIMMGPAMTCAFDLADAQKKLAVYDMVDFLWVDVHRPAAPDDIDRSGLIKAHLDMFLRGYKHTINQDLFDHVMRGRLLIEWSAITQDGYQSRSGIRTRFANLKQRIDIAFQT